jgi:hypothetical protein
MYQQRNALIWLASFALVFLLPVSAKAQDDKMTVKSFKLPDDTYKNGQRISIRMQYYKAYGDNHRLVAMTPEVVTVEDGSYTVEIENKYYKGEYYLEVIFDDGYVTPRILLSPIYEYLPRATYIFVGAFLIAIYCRIRFNRWTDKNIGKYSYCPRNYTTWTRFMRSLSIYVFLTELVYFALVISPGAFVFINKNMGGNPIEHEALKEMGEYGVLWAILLLTGVLPNFPWINKLEQKFRETLHDYAFIPAEAKAVISQLEVNLKAFDPDPKHIETVKNNFDLDDFSNEDFTAVKNGIAHKWCKLSYLRQRLQDWNTYPKINRFFAMSNETYEQLLKGYDSIKIDINNYNDCKGVDVQGVDTKYKKYLKAAENYINTEIDRLLKMAYSLISIGVLGTELLPAGRKDRFRYFGLRPCLTEGPIIDWDTNLKSLLAIIITATVPTLFYYFAMMQTTSGKLPSFVPKDSWEALFWALIGIAMHSSTVIAVVLFNLWRKTIFRGGDFKKMQRDSKNTNHFAVSMVAGFIGYCIGFFSMVAIMILQYYVVAKKDGFNVMGQLGGFALWSILPFVTGYFIQYYLDTPKKSLPSKWRMSIKQGTITAAIAGLIALIVLDANIGRGWHFIVFCTLTSFCVGSGIGYMFPKGYHRKVEASAKPEDERRKKIRYEVSQPATLIVANKNYACNIVEISLSGVKLDRKITCPVGTHAQINVPRLGKLNAIVVRMEKKKTMLDYVNLDSSEIEQLSGYIQSVADAA